jgi:hypothetical protein
LIRQTSLQLNKAPPSKSTFQQPLSTFFKLKPLPPPLPPPPPLQEEDIFKDIDSSDNEDSEFNAVIEAEFEAEDYAIRLDDLNDIEYIDNGRSELLLDSLIGDAINFSSEVSFTQKTYKEVLDLIKQQLNNKRLSLLPRLRFEYSLIQQYVQNLLKKSPRRNRIEASLLVAQSNHPTGDGKTLARKIRASFLYYRTHGSLPLETRGGKRSNRSYLDNEDVFKACRAWLLTQKLATVTPKRFRYALNTEIMPRLLATAKKAKKPLLGLTTGTRKNPGKKPREWKSLGKTAIYKWLNRLGFYATTEKKGVYIDGHERPDVIEYRQNDFLPKIAQLQLYSTNYEEDANSVLQPITPDLPFREKEHVIYYHDESCFHAKEYSKRIWLDENQ